MERAIEAGDVNYLRRLLKVIDHWPNRSGIIEYPFAGTESRTLLHIACIAGKRESVVELLKAGADPNAVDENKIGFRRARRRGLGLTMAYSSGADLTNRARCSHSRAVPLVWRRVVHLTDD